MKHWLNYANDNRQAAERILELAAAGDESVSCLIEWAEKILAKQSSPAEPGKLEHVRNCS